MRLLDSGQRDAGQALGSWFLELIEGDELGAVRWQTGFFTADSLGHLAPILDRLRLEDGVVKVLVGSNNRETTLADVQALAGLVGLGRSNGRLGVVSFAGSFFHSKIYHFTRHDGSQAAYVGSANLTRAGVSGLHVEAGLVLDSREADDNSILTSLSESIDGWFVDPVRPGLTIVSDDEALVKLGGDGVLALQPPPRSTPAGTRSDGPTGSLPRLRPLIIVPAWASSAAQGSAENDSGDEAHAAPRSVQPQTVAVTTRAGFPDYLLFSPEADAGPTLGVQALSGRILPAGASGLIVRLNRDSARHFSGGSGTANMSVPVATLPTLRFGIYRGKYQRPRAEFSLAARHVSSQGIARVATVSTGIMAYGFTPGEVGHGDVRMVVPAQTTGELLTRLQGTGLQAPRVGDFALLEWPTPDHPEFRLSYLEAESQLHHEAADRFEAALNSGTLVGDGACWLLPGLSPSW